MRGKGEPTGWITRHGVHVPIFGSYTVRGGVEPKAKGSKFKGFKKKKRDREEANNATEERKTKYADRDWNKDVDDAKRYGYSEQTEEGKKPVTKDEEYKSKLAEANKAFDSGDYKKANAMYKDLKKMQASGEVSDETITGKTKSQRERDEQKSQARQKAFEANSLVDEGMDKEEARKAVTEQESSTPKTNKTDAYNDKIFADFKANGKDYQRVPMERYAGTTNDFRAAAKRAGVDIEYDKDDDMFYLRKSKQESSTPEEKKAITARTNAGSRYGTTNYSDMTVEGLKAAMAGARPGDKAKIRAALRAKGYVYKGGKWVKV